jgi:lysyl-tRNA synthetase class 2
MNEEPREPATSELPVPVEGWPAESAQRLEKARALRARGVNTYPTRYERTHTLAEAQTAFGGQSAAELEAQAPQARLAGRVLTKRVMGKASFATLSDGEGRFQVYLRKDEIGAEAYELFVDLVDLGDFIGVAGRVMRTRTGELSVQAHALALLSKALLPPPEKWHGLSDVEVRYRQRYVDLVANPEVRKVFVARSAIVAELRAFLDGRGYVEVETPMMHAIAGGALARPFRTHHNALGIDLYLRIAPELYLKRLVVGGLERVYEINRNFRNEGISAMHNPEFTMLEFYTAYFDCRDVMAATEAMIVAAARRVGLTGETSYKGRPLSFAGPFRRLRMVDGIAEALASGPAALADLRGDDVQTRAGLDALVARADFRAACAARGVDADYVASLSHGKRIAQLFGELVEPALWQPTFVIDFPVEISPLAKARTDDPEVADRFELYAAGMEIANGFSELNDPLEQRERFVDQLRQRADGDVEAHEMDDDYVRALGHGMPPTGGCGVGIDRLTMLLTDSASIRDVILFPQMRPEGGRRRADAE